MSKVMSKAIEVTHIMENSKGVTGYVHRHLRVAPDRDAVIMSWRAYLKDLEDEARYVREALEHTFSDQRIEMEIEATVKNLQKDYPDCVAYERQEGTDDWFDVLAPDADVLATISWAELNVGYLVTFDENGDKIDG
jgi:hypothetical protein